MGRGQGWVTRERDQGNVGTLETWKLNNHRKWQISIAEYLYFCQDSLLRKITAFCEKYTRPKSFPPLQHVLGVVVLCDTNTSHQQQQRQQQQHRDWFCIWHSHSLHTSVSMLYAWIISKYLNFFILAISFTTYPSASISGETAEESKHI